MKTPSSVISGKNNPHLRPFLRHALYFHFPSMRFDQVLYDGKAEARAAHLARAGGIYAVEPLAEPRKVLFRYSDPRILHKEEGPAVLFADAEGHSALVGELDRVVNEVGQDLDQPVAVGHDRPNIGSDGCLEVDSLGRCFFLQDGQDRVGDIIEGHRRLVHADDAQFYLRDGHEVVHEAVDALAVRPDGLNEFEGVLPVVQRAFEERLGEALDGGDGGLELVGNVGHEVLAHLLQLLELGDIVEDGDEARQDIVSMEERRDPDHAVALLGPVERELRRPRGAAGPDFVQEREEFAVPDDLDERPAHEGGIAEEIPGCGAREENDSIAIDDDKRVRYASQYLVQPFSFLFVLFNDRLQLLRQGVQAVG